MNKPTTSEGKKPSELMKLVDRYRHDLYGTRTVETCKAAQETYDKLQSISDQIEHTEQQRDGLLEALNEVQGLLKKFGLFLFASFI